MTLFVGRIQAILDGAAGRRAALSVRGARVEVELELLPEARVGDSVLVHAGVALALLEQEPSREGVPCA